ncbi:hypothetical protein NP493_4157g00014 [Ridgeia piscesae]|uniref:Reverse transcriptase domain-containing protein n=1 Tax=Ridgeia piscesae TaxID=27915 RepID=A0AAD9J1J7_RIDPI|nr:hypothetical protein NP493_4157g00014 [Ridgeia piscesae]
MAIKFIDMQKAYATIPREMTMGTLGWMGVPEAEVRTVEGTYGDTKIRVLCGPGVSGESKINVGLTQGSALISLLFIAVVQLTSRKICAKDILLYAYCLAVVADGEANLQERLIEWKDIFSRHGLRYVWRRQR